MAPTTPAAPAPPPTGRRRRFPIRLKLAAALAIPLIAMGVITLAEVVSVASDAREVRDQTKLATASIGPGGLITALQDERNWASAAIVGVDSQLDMVVAGYDETRSATDTARHDFETELEQLGDRARAAYAPVLERLDGLPELRTQVDATDAASSHTFDDIGPATVVFDQYTALIEPFFAAMSRLSVSIDDPDLRQGAALAETTARLLEVMPQLANALALPSVVPTAPDDTKGINSTAEIRRVAELQSAFRQHTAAMAAASGRYAPIADEYFDPDYTKRIDDLTVQAIETGNVTVDQLVNDLDQSLDRAYIGYRDHLADAIQSRAGQLNDEATSRQRLWVLVLGATFVGAVVLTVLASVSITRPLHSLTDQAKEMAGRRLPNAVSDILSTPLGEDVTVPSVPPVRVTTRDEVADVADALNTVQDSALDLAIEQAVLRRNIADSFVNLGRRNQNLLGRQLDFITELESSETDPDTLSSLFRLDHLATRMRRNAESLLVLAGIEPPRQWAAPLQLTDIIRAALSEVEDYQRVTVRGVEPATIVGSAAADIAHLLAELIENALHYSPPDRSVDVKGRRGIGARGDADGYRLAVVDAGLGMSPEDVESANRRLAGVESFTVAPSKYLGHYVAGNLAARHGIHVTLHDGAGGGVMATIDLPAALLADAGTGAASPPAVPGPAGLAGARGPTGAPDASGPGHRAPAVAAPGSALTGLPLSMPRGLGAPASGPGIAAPGRTPDRPPLPARGAGPVLPTAPAAPAVPAAPAARAATSAPHASFAAGAPPAPPSGPTAGPPLARRTRGAQMPSTSLHSVPRHAGPAGRTAAAGPLSGVGRGASGPPSGGPAPAPPAPPDTASELYGFLTDFTAGVRRGLDAAGDAGRRGT